MTNQPATLEPETLWNTFKNSYCEAPGAGIRLDYSRMNFPAGYLAAMEPAIQKAYAFMKEVEAGAIANPDEKRQVGHYWLRNPDLAPAEHAQQIKATLARIHRFAADVLGGKIVSQSGQTFVDLLIIGIGGSALGPQFVSDALGDPAIDRMKLHFFDNTDPDGMDRVLRSLGDRLPRTLCLVISKSGGTPETRNGMLVAKAAFNARKLDFGRHAVAVTGVDSKLDQVAKAENWLDRFPMWDWVGGRTSQTAAVGLLPMALQGLDIDQFLAGAAASDAATRSTTTRNNPAALMALAWHHATRGRGEKDLVILPYKDRLALLSKYLQQLIMESLGKRLDLDGRTVHQGIAVYGNKGSTDQHAYIQQLRDGVNNFFATFIHVLQEGGSPLAVEEGITSGDYLNGLLLGTRRALYESDRLSLTITVPRVDAFQVGSLIGLFERAVGFYATLVNVNAYHQPGVEAGKSAAGDVLKLQTLLMNHLLHQTAPATADQIAAAMGKPQEAETLFHLLEHLAANGRGVKIAAGTGPEARFVKA